MKGRETMEQYQVTGMSCAACSARVEKAVSSVEGVTSCSVSLLTNSMGVEGTADSSVIIKGIKKHNDVISRFFKTGVSLSFNKSASEELLCVCTPFFFAPYPASSTALMITDESVNGTYDVELADS